MQIFSLSCADRDTTFRLFDFFLSLGVPCLFHLGPMFSRKVSYHRCQRLSEVASHRCRCTLQQGLGEGGPAPSAPFRSGQGGSFEIFRICFCTDVHRLFVSFNLTLSLTFSRPRSRPGFIILGIAGMARVWGPRGPFCLFTLLRTRLSSDQSWGHDKTSLSRTCI